MCRAAATACTIVRGPLASRPACRPRPPAEQHHLPGSRSASGLSSCPFLPPRAAAFGSPPKSPAACTHSRIFKNKQAPSLPPRRWLGFSQARASRSLEVCWQGPERDVRAVTRCSRRGSLGAPRALTVRLESALPPCVSPPVLRCSVRIARL